MPIKYSMNILAALKNAGYNTSRLRREKLLPESVIQQLRHDQLVSWINIGRLCRLLDCQPGKFCAMCQKSKRTNRRRNSKKRRFSAARFFYAVQCPAVQPVGRHQTSLVIISINLQGHLAPG